MRITGRSSRSFVGMAVALSVLFAGCGSDGTSAKPTAVADLRVSPVAATPTVPGVCAPKPARPTMADGANSVPGAAMPAKPGTCAK